MVAVHAHGALGMKRAIRAGVDSVEHGTYMDEEAMRLMRKNGTWYVPTISAGKWVGDLAELDNKLPAWCVQRPRRLAPRYKTPLVRHTSRGSKLRLVLMLVCLRTEPMARNFGSWLKPACPSWRRYSRQPSTLLIYSMSRMIWDRSHPDFTRDIVAFNENPLEDVRVLERPNFVMKAGAVFRHDGE